MELQEEAQSAPNYFGVEVESTVPAYSGVTPAPDTAVGVVHPTLSYVAQNPMWIGPPPLPEFTAEGVRKAAAEGARDALVRKFDTGATRSADAGRPDPEGFLSPLVIDRYCQYMSKNRLQPDGTIRDSDNWQKGIPLATYMKGLWRHMLHAWTRHRGYEVDDPKAAQSIEEDLCAVIFNSSGYLHELLVRNRKVKPHA